MLVCGKYEANRKYSQKLKFGSSTRKQHRRQTLQRIRSNKTSRVAHADIAYHAQRSQLVWIHVTGDGPYST